MKHLVATAGALTAYLAMTGSAHAVFSAPAQVPEPASLGLLAAGGLALAVVRYLRKRKDKRDE